MRWSRRARVEPSEKVISIACGFTTRWGTRRLGVPVETEKTVTIEADEMTLEGFCRPLAPVDRPSLLDAFVHGEDDAPIDQLVVDARGRRCHHERDRPVHLVLVGGQPPRPRVFGRGRDGEGARRLEERHAR